LYSDIRLRKTGLSLVASPGSLPGRRVEADLVTGYFGPANGIDRRLGRGRRFDNEEHVVFEPSMHVHDGNDIDAHPRDVGSHVPVFGEDSMAGSGLRETLSTDPQCENMAKNVDFRTAQGAALLGKALTRQALASLPDSDKLKSAPAALRADVIECVSTCVAILTRARTTRNGHAIEELVDALRVKAAKNYSAIAAIQRAVKEFDTTSSESE
jgi:hypothetical protein